MMFCFQNAHSQTGTWNGSTSTETKTQSDVGIGTFGPDGKTEIFIDCPEKNGLIITKDLTCPPLFPSPGGTSAQENVTAGELLSNTGNTTTGFVGMPFPFNVGNLISASSIGSILTTSISSNPLFWIRTKNLSSAALSTDTRFIVTPSSKIGINVFNPRATLDVRLKVAAKNHPVAIFGLNSIKQGAGIFDQYTTRHIQVVPRCGENGYNQITQDDDLGIFFTDGKAPDGANLTGSLVIAPWAIASTTNPIGGIRIDQQGNVELHGNARATKVTVNAIWWSDFVFAEDYTLLSLPELERFIKAKKHLPNIPSEKEVLANGIDIAEVQTLQLQKIEELTLYAIEQNKKTVTQQLQIDELKGKQAELLLILETLIKK